GFDRGRSAVDLHRIAEAPQHALGMITGGCWLGDRGLAFGIQPRQQQAGFDLRARHGHDILHTLELTLGPLDKQRWPAVGTGIDARTHLPQRIGDPPHWRLVREASPASSVVNCWPASSPASSRMEVPELPT